MPTYEYFCTACRKSFTVVTSMAEHEKHKRPRCPKCHKAANVEPRVSDFFALTSKKS